MSEHEHAEPKPSGSTKTVLVLLVIIAIIIPLVLGVALIKDNGTLFATTNAPPPVTTSSGSTGGSSIVMPQGAGSGLNFSPSTLTVASGTTITWTDQDTVAPHNVYFTSVPSGATNPNPAGGPPTMTSGDTYSVTLTTPGTYDFECQFHASWMQGTITVTG